MIHQNKRDHILEIAINTNVTNSLDDVAFRALTDSLAQVKVDLSIKVVVLTARGEKFFSNGFEPTMFLDRSYEEVCELLQPAMAATSELLFCPVPVVCLINGHCMGVGAVMAIFTDYRIMIQGKARFGFPESQIGLNFPSVPGYVLKELVGVQNARQILFSGKPMKAGEALEMGLVDEAIPLEEVSSRLDRYCNQFEKMATESVRGIKKSMIDYMRPTVEELSRNDTEELAKAVVSENGQEGLRSILERRRPVFRS